MKRLGWIVSIGALVAMIGCTDMSPQAQGTMSGAAIGAGAGAGIAAISGGALSRVQGTKPSPAKNFAAVSVSR